MNYVRAWKWLEEGVKGEKLYNYILIFTCKKKNKITLRFPSKCLSQRNKQQVFAWVWEKRSFTFRGAQPGAISVEFSVGVSQTLEIDQPHDLAILLLGIFHKDSILHYEDTCSSMLVVLLRARK